MTVLSLPPLEPTTPPGIGAPEDDSPLRSVSTAVAVLDCFASEAELGATKVAAAWASPRAPRAACSPRWPPGACSNAPAAGATGSACGCSSTGSSRSTGSCSATSRCP